LAESDAAADLGDVAFLFEYSAAFSTARLVGVALDGCDVALAIRRGYCEPDMTESENHNVARLDVATVRFFSPGGEVLLEAPVFEVPCSGCARSHEAFGLCLSSDILQRLTDDPAHERSAPRPSFLRG